MITPLPSCPRPQDDASPVILTTLRRALTTAAVSSTCGSGADTGEMFSGATPANTRGKVEPPTTSRKLSATPTNSLGTNESIAWITLDEPTALDSAGEGEPRTAPATNQSTSETATRPATAPAT